MDQAQAAAAEKLQQYQLNDALMQIRNTLGGMAQQGIPYEVATTAMMISIAGAMATVAVYKGISHDDAQKQLADGTDKMRSYLAKVYTEVEAEKAKVDAEKADQPDWMHPERLPGNGSAAQ